MSKKVLNKFLRKWVRILKLSKPKWNKITIDFNFEKLSPGTVGLSCWSTEESEAEIFIIPPEKYLEYFEKEMTDAFIEKVVIHELLHLVLDAGKCGKIKYEPHYEQGLNILADVLREAWQ